jgi:hypothetical protein
MPPSLHADPKILVLTARRRAARNITALAVGRVAMTKDSAKAVVRGNAGRLAERIVANGEGSG